MDYANELSVELANGALSSANTTEVLGGRNIAALIDAAGDAEIIGFRTATLVGPRQWRLSSLFRGLGGETHLARRTLAPGAIFVLLDQAVVSLVSDMSQLGLTHRYRVGPSHGDFADPACVEFSTQVSPKALMPYAPVHASATRGASGVEIKFLRRGRLDADGWEIIDTPLGEEREAYEIEVLDGGSVVRTLYSVATTALYPAALEIEDFGAVQDNLAVRIFQMSALVGRGFPLSTILPVY